MGKSFLGRPGFVVACLLTTLSVEASFGGPMSRRTFSRCVGAILVAGAALPVMVALNKSGVFDPSSKELLGRKMKEEGVTASSVQLQDIVFLPQAHWTPRLQKGLNDPAVRHEFLDARAQVIDSQKQILRRLRVLEAEGPIAIFHEAITGDVSQYRALEEVYFLLLYQTYCHRRGLPSPSGKKFLPFAEKVDPEFWTDVKNELSGPYAEFRKLFPIGIPPLDVPWTEAQDTYLGQQGAAVLLRYHREVGDALPTEDESLNQTAVAIVAKYQEGGPLYQKYVYDDRELFALMQILKYREANPTPGRRAVLIFGRRHDFAKYAPPIPVRSFENR